MTKYALVRVAEGWYNINSKLGIKLKQYNNIITVKKMGKVLYWYSGDCGIPPKHIVEVLQGDITEYMI